MQDQVNQIKSPSTTLEAPSELQASLEHLLPTLSRHGVERLKVFSYNRPGEPSYWLAYLFIAGHKRSLGTPDLRHRPLHEQLKDLVDQLARFPT